MARGFGTDYDMEDKYGGCTEQRFRARSDLQEGTAGCARIDTTFENTERPQVLRPRSLDRPANAIGGRSPENYTSDEFHGEWEGGPDRPIGSTYS